MVTEYTPADAAVRAAAALASAQLADLVALLAACPPTAVPETIEAVESAGRLMDAARVLATAPLARDRVAAERLGFASPVAAVATFAQVTERSARARLYLADSISPDLSVSGAELPPQHPEVAAALTAGQIGMEAAILIAKELDSSAPRVPAPARAMAETMMVNLACGKDPAGIGPLPPASVDYLTGAVRTLGAAIDPDGSRPREERAAQRRSVWIHQPDADGLMQFGGRLEQELGILFLNFVEAWRRSPRFTDTNEPQGAEDTRTPDQRRHDAFAEILIAAAAADDAPQLNGHPVAVVVTVRQEDLVDPEGVDGDPIGIIAGSPVPLSRRRVEQLIDGNGFRAVTLTAEGAVTGISSPARCFTSKQTLAIAARDGYRCSAPGCTTPHTALQAHHVIAWRVGGPTSTSNGILLCYWHHRRVDDGPWQYRMVNGLPEVRGPGIPEWTRNQPDWVRAA